MFKIIKLVTGEMVAGDCEADQYRYVIKNPLHIGLVPAPNGQSMMIKMFPYNPFGMMEKSISIQIEHILLEITKYPPNIQEEYDKVINPKKSNIITPDSMNSDGTPKLTLI